VLKRVIAFVLVLVAGLLVLELARGDRDPFRGATSRTASRPESRRGNEANAQFRVSGDASFEKSGPVTGPDGRKFSLPRYTLTAKDTQPLDEDRQELVRTHVVFHEWSFLPNGDPLLREAAILDALRMIVGLDRKGGLDQSQQMQISGVRFTVRGRGTLQGLVLEADRMLALPSDDLVRAWTEGELDPFTLKLTQSDTDYVLRGNGLDLRFPAGQSPGAAEVLIRADTRLESVDLPSSPRSLRATSRGPTRFTTPPGRQDVGRLQLSEAIDVTLDERGVRALRARSDTMELDLRRLADDRMVVEQGRLTGTPVRLDVQGAELRGARADFTADGAGDLQHLVLTGQPSATVPGQRLKRDVPLELSAADTIEVIEIDALSWAAAALGVAGPGALVPTRWITLSGRTEARGALDLETSGGLRIALGEPDLEPILMRGFGTVGVTLPQGRATGSDGFRFRQTPGGSTRFWLGPEQVSAAHTYDVALATGSVRGRGSFLLEQDPGPEGRTSLHLEEPGEGSIEAQIRAGVPAPGGSAREVTLHGARLLDLELLGDRLQSLRAAGRLVKLGDPASGIAFTGRTVRTLADGVLHVSGQPGDPATLHNEGGPGRPVSMAFDVHATEFGLRPSASGRPALSARHDVVLTTLAAPPRSGALPGFGDRKVDLTCDELDYLPGLVPDDSLDLAALPGGEALASLWLQALGSGGEGWLLVRRRVHVTAHGNDGARDVLRGSLLVLSADGGERAVLLGPGASLRHDKADGGSYLCRASRISKDGSRILIGDPQGNPGALLRVSGAADLLGRPGKVTDQPTITEIVCGQPIRISDQEVVSRGPCLITTVESPPPTASRPAAGIEDELHPTADGLRVESSGFRLLRNPAGDIREVILTGPVVLRRGTMSAYCDFEMRFDPTTQWLKLVSLEEAARIERPPSVVLVGERIEFNLKTLGSIVHKGALGDPKVKR
jgi:hypothetical protein